MVNSIWKEESGVSVTVGLQVVDRMRWPDKERVRVVVCHYHSRYLFSRVTAPMLSEVVKLTHYRRDCLHQVKRCEKMLNVDVEQVQSC